MFKGDNTSSKQLLRTYVKMKDEDVDEGEDVFFCLAIHAYRWLIFNQYQKFAKMHLLVCHMKCH